MNQSNQNVDTFHAYSLTRSPGTKAASATYAHVCICALSTSCCSCTDYPCSGVGPTTCFLVVSRHDVSTGDLFSAGRKRWLSQSYGSDYAAFWFVPFAVETCECMGKEVVKFVNRLGDIAAESGRIAKDAFVRWAMQLPSVTVQRGDAEMYRRSGLIISREQGLR